MKKLSIIVILALVCALCFAGCGEKPEDNSVNLASVSEGTELTVYPECEFDYKYKKGNDEYIFHVSSISAKLTKKNSIGTNDLIEEDFYRYEITLSTSGYADASLSGQKIYLRLSAAYTNWAITCYIDNDGKFSGSRSIGYNNQNLPQLIFCNIGGLN